MTSRTTVEDILLGRMNRQEPEIYVEQVHQLFGHMNLVVMGALGVLLTDGIAYMLTGDAVYVGIAAVIMAITAVRYWMLRRYESAVPSMPSDMADKASVMRRWEVAYSIPTLAFAALVGLLTYCAMAQPNPELHVYIAFFTSIFAGNLAIRHATHLRIVAAQVVLIMGPFALGVVLETAPYYWWLLAMVPMQIMSIRSTTGLIHGMLGKALNAAFRSRVLSSQLEAALGNMSQGLCMTDAGGRIVVMNPQLVTVMGLSSDLSVGSNLSEALSAAGEADVLAADYQGGGPAKHLIATRNGRFVEVRVRKMPGGAHLVVAEDVSDREAADRRIKHMAHYDYLTSLPNRIMFRSRMEEAFAASADTGESFALLCLDLDMFKEVNDTLGHPIGDRLLVEVANRLRGMVHGTDVVGRFGGDEFMILHHPGKDEEITSCLAERLVVEVSRPYRILGHDINIGLSIGVAISGGHGEDVDSLLKNADMALYKSKKEGRGRYCFFRTEMDEEAQRRRVMEADMRQAISEEAFTVFYQPIVDAQTGAVRSCEALVRWMRNGKMVSPDEFISLAEETGLIVPLGGIVLRKACMEAVTWPSDVGIAVNFSAVQFKRNSVVSQVTEALRLSGLAAHRLEVEITESEAMGDMLNTQRIVEEVRKLGVKVALDDFGKGQTSLSYMDEIAFDKVKIDKAFIDEIETNPMRRNLVKLIASFARDCDKNLVAEGVETVGQLEVLRSVGVPQVQGYLFSKPRPGDEIAEFLKAPPIHRAPLRAVAA